MSLRSLCAVSGCRCVGAVEVELEEAASYGGGGPDGSMLFMNFESLVVSRRVAPQIQYIKCREGCAGNKDKASKSSQPLQRGGID